jgi:hypothetical protein
LSNNDKTPEVGTFAWVKWDSEMRKRHERVHSTTGGW